MKTYVILLCMSLTLAITGCDTASDSESGADAHQHDHDVPPHMPRSLYDLSQQVRARLGDLDENGDHLTLKSELTDLVSWAPEFAADTEIPERLWIPIYDLSESIRISIEKQPENWDLQRRDQITRLCQISEDAWWSLESDQRVDRYQGHHHGDHDHEHGHGHGHDHDHDHAHDGDEDHAHGDHDHEHGHSHDHGHDHEHGHSHDHASDQEHGHSHKHDTDHAHDHDHAHEHSHDDDHGHDHDHGHEHGHSHDHDANGASPASAAGGDPAIESSSHDRPETHVDEERP